MEKPRTKKPKTIQMKYPAPYSHSWACPQTEKPEKHKIKKAKKKPSLLQNNLLAGCCRRNNPKSVPNPYAPHLKYGIFPQNAPKTRNISSTMNANSTSRDTDQRFEEPSDEKGENKKAKKAKLSDTPLFVIRPIDKKQRRQLTLSETLHLDIRPRRNLPHSPNRKPSPLFKSAIVKMNSNIKQLNINK